MRAPNHHIDDYDDEDMVQEEEFDSTVQEQDDFIDVSDPYHGKIRLPSSMMIIGDLPQESEIQRLEGGLQIQQQVPFGTLEEQNDQEMILPAGAN